MLGGTLEAIFAEFVVVRYFNQNTPVGSATLPLLTRYMVFAQKFVKCQSKHFIPLVTRCTDPQPLLPRSVQQTNQTPNQAPRMRRKFSLETMNSHATELSDNRPSNPPDVSQRGIRSPSPERSIFGKTLGPVRLLATYPTDQCAVFHAVRHCRFSLKVSAWPSTLVLANAESILSQR